VRRSHFGQCHSNIVITGLVPVTGSGTGSLKMPLKFAVRAATDPRDEPVDDEGGGPRQTWNCWRSWRSNALQRARDQRRWFARLKEGVNMPTSDQGHDPLYLAALAVEQDAALAEEMAEWEAATIADGLFAKPCPPAQYR